MVRPIALLCLAIPALAIDVCAQTKPSPARYVNPLSIEDTRSIADPTVLRFHDKYYLFLTGGALWTSNDLLHWEHHAITLPGNRPTATAPDVFEYRGYVYLTGNNIGFYRAKDPMGAWEYFGDILDEKGKKILLFDSMGFVDDDGRLFLYFSGRRSDGIWGVELNPEDPRQFAAPPRKLWTFDNSHVWERYGDNNEGANLSWIEAPWMTKRNGTYYLQYSAPGTEWKTYAVGVYTSKHPLGPFAYAPRNPILVHQNGLINGTGHHTVVEGPDGNLWALYTILYRNHALFDRRIGLDPVGFDDHGNMFVAGPSEEPRWGPGGAAKPWADNRTGSIPVSINRYIWAASSMREGRDPSYAFDNNVRTWWEPEAADPQPWLMLDLGSRNPADANQEFLVDSVRILLDAAPAPRQNLVVDGRDRSADALRSVSSVRYRYKVEASMDNKNYFVIVDKTKNTQSNNVEFDEFRPVRCRYVRLTITERPADSTAILEFTVFGRSAP